MKVVSAERTVEEWEYFRGRVLGVEINWPATISKVDYKGKDNKKYSHQ